MVAIWGSVWALKGRSRVMLLVAGSIALAFGVIGFLGTLSDSNNSNGGGIAVHCCSWWPPPRSWSCSACRPAADFFAAHRARRGV